LHKRRNGFIELVLASKRLDGCGLEIAMTNVPGAGFTCRFEVSMTAETSRNVINYPPNSGFRVLPSCGETIDASRSLAALRHNWHLKSI
jgi:hypothetical protein